jgi:hypothetical protein
MDANSVEAQRLLTALGDELAMSAKVVVFCGEALPVTMGHIDDWIARNHVLATATTREPRQSGSQLPASRKEERLDFG